MDHRSAVVLVLVVTCGLVQANHMRIRNMRMQMRMPLMRRVPVVTTTPKPTTTTPAGEYEPPEIEGPVSTSTTPKPTTTTTMPPYPPYGHGFHFGRGRHFGGPPYGHPRFGPGWGRGGGPGMGPRGGPRGGPGGFHGNFGPGFKPGARMAMHNSMNNGFFPKRPQGPQFFNGPPPSHPPPPPPPPPPQRPPVPHSGKWIEIGNNNLRMGQNREVNRGRPFPPRDGSTQFSRPGQTGGMRSTASSPKTFSTRRGGSTWKSESFRNPQPNSWSNRQKSSNRQFDNTGGGRPSSQSSFGRQDNSFGRQSGGEGGGRGGRGSRNSGFNSDFGFGRTNTMGRGSGRSSGFGGSSAFGGGMSGNFQRSSNNWLMATSPMTPTAQSQFWNTPRNPPMPNPPPPQYWVTPAPKPWTYPTLGPVYPTTTMKTNSFTDVWGYPTTAASNWFLGSSKTKTNNNDILGSSGSNSNNNNNNSKGNIVNKNHATTTAIQPYYPTTQQVISNDPFVGMFSGFNRMMNSMMPYNPLSYMMFASK